MSESCAAVRPSTATWDHTVSRHRSRAALAPGWQLCIPAGSCSDSSQGEQTPEALREAVRCTAGRVPCPALAAPHIHSRQQQEAPIAMPPSLPHRHTCPGKQKARGSHPEQHGPGAYMHTAADSCRPPCSCAACTIPCYRLGSHRHARSSSPTQGVHKDLVFWQSPTGARRAACLLPSLLEL